MNLSDDEELYLSMLCDGPRTSIQIDGELKRDDDAKPHRSDSIKDILDRLSNTKLLKKTNNGKFKLTEIGRSKICNP